VHVVCADPDSALAVQSLFEVVTRSMLSNAPLHGGRIALHILSDPARKAAWCVGVGV
jgi:aspartate/tyrosine/aromatic aminotransferase